MADTQELRRLYQQELAKVEGIEVEAQPLMPYMTRGVRLTVPVMFRVKLGDFSQRIRRQPVHLCMVLDRSGSMSGTPLAGCKQAIKKVVRQLAAADRVSFVVYDDEAQTVFSGASAAEPAALDGLIDAVQCGGRTNISEGLAHAVSCLADTDVPGHQKVVFLFSDGQANCGVTNLDALGEVLNGYVQQGVQVTAYGIGANYNERWMRSIARAGKGNYFFIKDASMVEDLVERGTAAFTSTVANNAVLRIRAANGHTLASVQTLTSPDVLLHGYRLNALRSLGLYTVMADVELNPNPEMLPGADADADADGFQMVGGAEEGGDGAAELLRFELVFDAVDEALGLRPVRGRVALRYTEDDAKLQQRSPDVRCHLAMLECVPLDAAVDEALRQGKRDEALRLKREVLQKYEAVVHLDRYYIITSLLSRTRAALKLMEENVAAAQKYQGQATQYCRKAMKCRQKEEWEGELSEDDEDMGYGLFD